MTEQLPPETARLIDASMLGVVGAVALQFLPAIAALMAALWYGIQAYESKTAQGFLKRLRGKKKRRR